MSSARSSTCATPVCRLKDIAILVRVSSITKTFEDKLTLYNLPFRLIGGMKFYDRAEVKDFLAYLKCIANPRDGRKSQTHHQRPQPQDRRSDPSPSWNSRVRSAA